MFLSFLFSIWFWDYVVVKGHHSQLYSFESVVKVKTLNTVPVSISHWLVQELQILALNQDL